MTEHAQKFTGKAADYAQYRERYDPTIVLPVLREWCGLTPEWRIADVGAGTGMLGDLFRDNGNHVMAIEPNNEMRAACAALHSADERFDVIDGSAEHTTLPDAAVEMVAVGRALHWFDIDAAIREFRRVLKPGGWVAILACGRREDGREENSAYMEMMQATTGRNMMRDPLLAVYERLESFFPDGQFHHADIQGEMKLDWDNLRGLTLSISHTPMPGTPEFASFEQALRHYFDRYQSDGRIRLTTSTWMNVGQFAMQPAT